MTARLVRPSATLWGWYAANAALLIAAVLVPVWLKAADARYHNYDLGIFAQALHRFSFSNPNPFLGAINARIFSEHLDPIFIPFAPLAHFLAPDSAALFAEHLLILLAPLPVILLALRGRIPASIAFVAVPFLFFNRGILSALDFPVHPTTWASTFAVLFACALVSERRSAILLTAILLMACKEEYPFAVALAGVVLLAGPQRRTGIVLIVGALAWLWLAFWLRPWLTGSTQPYAARIMDPLLADPAGLLWRRFTDPKAFTRPLEMLVPLLPLIVWQFRARRGWNWVLLAAVLPLLAIRFIDQAWKFHYLAPVAAFALAVFFTNKEGFPMPRWVAILTLVLLAGFAVGPVTKLACVYGDWLAPSQSQTIRRAALTEARTRLLADSAGGARVEGNLLPRLAAMPDVFQIGGVQREEHRTFRWVLAEKPPAGNPWPLQSAELTAIVEGWRHTPGVRIHRDDAAIFFAEGLFRE